MVDREIIAYRTVLEYVMKYLADKYLSKSKFLPIPGYVKIVEKNPNTQLRSLFMLEKMRQLNYKRDLIKNCEGLNYEHSVLVVATLAGKKSQIILKITLLLTSPRQSLLCQKKQIRDLKEY